MIPRPHRRTPWMITTQAKSSQICRNTYYPDGIDAALVGTSADRIAGENKAHHTKEQKKRRDCQNIGLLS